MVQANSLASSALGEGVCIEQAILLQWRADLNSRLMGVLTYSHVAHLAQLLCHKLALRVLRRNLVDVSRASWLGTGRLPCFSVFGIGMMQSYGFDARVPAVCFESVGRRLPTKARPTR